MYFVMNLGNIKQFLDSFLQKASHRNTPLERSLSLSPPPPLMTLLVPL